MHKERIALISQTAAVCSWCTKELADVYTVKIYSPSHIMSSCLCSDNIRSVLVDSLAFREVELCALCMALLKQDDFSIIILMPPRGVHDCIKELFPHVQFAGMNDPSGDLKTKIISGERRLSSARIIKYGGSSVPESMFSRGTRRFFSQIKNAFGSDCSVLLLGESGCGKGYTAELIHKKSSRKDAAFRVVNLAERESNLLESELCGTVRGAFTGSENTEGIFSEARGGSLFLDEISEMDRSMQGKLLGVLDNGVYRKIGSSKELKLSARLISATDADLVEMVRDGKFRRQLFYRIAVMVIEVPPLRERMEDVSVLALEFASAENKMLSSGALKKLNGHSWPGNIRELKNCIKCACNASPTESVGEESINFVRSDFYRQALPPC